MSTAEAHECNHFNQIEIIDFSKEQPDPTELQLLCSLLDIDPQELIEPDTLEEEDDQLASLDWCRLLCDNPKLFKGKLTLNDEGCFIGERAIGNHLFFY